MVKLKQQLEKYIHTNSILKLQTKTLLDKQEEIWHTYYAKATIKKLLKTTSRVIYSYA